MIKTAFIRKIDKNTWRVYSEKGRNLGTYHSLKAAKKRLKDVEFFKRKEKLLKKNNDRTVFYKTILAKEDKHHQHENTYSSFLRHINKHHPNKMQEIMSRFKKIFDKALLDETPIDDLENTCLLELQASLKEDSSDE